ncbi:MAG: hypothetical protein HKN43_15205 [Rhodothermales bacterium]|nr:hypothetical protein [Rhodothermales bacterium]
MALYVVDKSEGEKVPFLRGILTRSLVKAGLSFDEAYRVADETREKLSSRGEVTKEELRRVVAKALSSLELDDVLSRYRARGQQFTITVTGRDGVISPFSRVLLEQSLDICALGPEQMEHLLQAVEASVRSLGQTVVSSSHIARLVYQHLLEFTSKESAHRYLLWLEFNSSGTPLVLLIGGTTGSGKSTIAAELSHSLNIVRTQSTDMLREVMRIMLPKRLLPTLHESSFSAYRAIPNSVDSISDTDSLEIGYLTQAERVGVAISAVLDRAVTEGVSIIIEGVHMHPELMRELESKIDAIVVPVIVASTKKKNLRKQLKGRGKMLSSRRSQRYMDNFESIWALQTFLLSESERLDVTIIPSTDLQDATSLMKEFIAEVLGRYYKADPEELLGKDKIKTAVSDSA